jgi:hypothetical protein
LPAGPRSGFRRPVTPLGKRGGGGGGAWGGTAEVRRGRCHGAANGGHERAALGVPVGVSHGYHDWGVQGCWGGLWVAYWCHTHPGIVHFPFKHPTALSNGNIGGLRAAKMNHLPYISTPSDHHLPQFPAEKNDKSPHGRDVQQGIIGVVVSSKEGPRTHEHKDKLTAEELANPESTAACNPNIAEAREHRLSRFSKIHFGFVQISTGTTWHAWAVMYRFSSFFRWRWSGGTL